MTAPAVSVVIPTFNRRRQVEQAVKSVLSQTFADLELLVVDGGDDGTAESLAGRDARLRYERVVDDTGPASCAEHRHPARAGAHGRLPRRR